MKKFFTSNDHVLPRPIEKLPEYAHAKARRTLAEKLIEAFHLSDAAADAIANAVVDPSAVRKSIGETSDPQVERIAVPGGLLLGIRTSVWSRRIMPDPRNPRIGPTRRHPFAVVPGTGDEDTRFRPVPEPRSPDGKPDDVPELVVEIDSRHHLEWASAQAAKFILKDNDWRDSIRSQGVMEAVWLAATTYLHADGPAPATAVVSVEGSSRTAAVHNILEVRSSDVPYDDPDRKLRSLYKALGDAFEQGTHTLDQTEAIRCERMPALILVGFRRNGTNAAGFPTAVKSLVALRHVDPPKAWGEGPANESLADEVLDELFRRNLVTGVERAYYAASCTKAEARAAHLPDDPSRRAARIVALFARADDATAEAIHVAVTSQSTRRRISRKMCNELATALIVRSVASDIGKLDQVRRYLRHSFGQAVYAEPWESTNRDTDSLARDAIAEVQRAMADENIVEPGPASLELSVRGAYALVVTGGLHSDRGTRGAIQPDRRLAGEVLDSMRRSVPGVHQLAQALRDFAAGQHIRAVDENGTIKKRSDGATDFVVNDAYLRQEFAPPGKARARSGGPTPTEQLNDRLADFSDAMDRLQAAFKGVAAVAGNDGSPLVEVEGVEPSFCATRRQLLSRIGDEFNFWDRTYRRRHGIPATMGAGGDTDEEENDVDEFEQEPDTDAELAEEDQDDNGARTIAEAKGGAR
ncbi:MAG: hypothetical protein WD063_11015 [Pirellulales bacterium]